MPATARDALFLVVLFVANTVQAITGFAGTVLAMPFSILLIGANEAKVVLGIMALVSCLWLAVAGRRFIKWRELARILVFMAVGMVAGYALYAVCPVRPLQQCYGVVIMLIAIINLVHPVQGRLPQALMVLILLAAGVMHGMFVSGGALLVVYAAAMIPGKDEFRATVASVWVVLNSVLLVTQIASGQVTSHALMLTGLGLPALALAIALGSWLARRISQQGFLRLSYALLLVSGASIAI